jgi:hypothetical protein
MKYLLLLYDDAAAIAALPAEQRRAMVDAHIAFAARLRDTGAYVYGDPLDGPDAARTLRFDSGNATVTDGPFLESKEALGGFYVVDCPSLEDAVNLAAQVPRSPGLVAEVRPIPEI